ncbi:MAG: GWxTD domain-containing protein [Gemmatimonadales bacterium]
MIRRALLLAVFALAPARAALAQQPAERAALDSIRAAYEAQSDTVVLIRREHEKIAVARADRDNVMLHMELGYLAYRLGEIAKSHSRYNDAASEFQWASDLRPQWPYAWYWLGRSELASGESQVIILENIRQLLGIDYLGNAAHHFARAIQADPGFSAGIVDLVTTAMRQRVATHLTAVQAVLREVAAGPAGRVPEVQFVRGLIERRLEQPDSALGAFRAYLALGGDSGIGGVEVARTEALAGRADSSRTWYFRGVTRALSDSARREVRRDLRWIATAAELAAFDAAAPDSVAAFLHAFWERRDAADGRRAGERLAEQFRRYHYAMTRYGLASRHRNLDPAFAFGDSTQTDFDDRGVVYLRHGEPSQRAQFAAPGFDANESWLYHRNPPEGDLIVHFAAVNDVSDFRLMESLRAVCGSRSRYVEPLVNANLNNRRLGQPTNMTPLEDTRCLETRADLSDMYARLARVPSTSADMWAAERTASLEMVRAAVTTDSYVHHYDASLRPVVSWFVMADTEMRPELHLVFAVSATRLHPVAAAEGAVIFPLTLRLFVTDSATGLQVAALDTVRSFHSAQRLGPGAFLTDQLVLRVPAGRHRWAFVIEEQHASAGDAVTRQMINVPALAGGFAVSDIVLGREGSGLTWRHRGGDVPLNPLMRFPRDGDATLYYELYGLAQGASVATRVRVIQAGGRSLLRRLFGGGGGGADLAYSTVTDAAGRSTVRQLIALKGLSPGRYTLQVELTDEATGTRIVRASPFEIGGGSAP